jgi:hypothetical protein
MVAADGIGTNGCHRRQVRDLGDKRLSGRMTCKVREAHALPWLRERANRSRADTARPSRDESDSLAAGDRFAGVVRHAWNLWAPPGESLTGASFLAGDHISVVRIQVRGARPCPHNLWLAGNAGNAAGCPLVGGSSEPHPSDVSTRSWSVPCVTTGRNFGSPRAAAPS